MNRLKELRLERRLTLKNMELGTNNREEVQ